MEKIMVYVDISRVLEMIRNLIYFLIIDNCTSKWYIKTLYYVENFMLIPMIYRFIRNQIISKTNVSRKIFDILKRKNLRLNFCPFGWLRVSIFSIQSINFIFVNIGEYEYLMTAFGNLLGFLFVWAQLIIVIPTANAVAALTFSDYLLQPIYPNCEIPHVARVCIAASAVCKFHLNLYCVSIPTNDRINNVFFK